MQIFTPESQHFGLGFGAVGQHHIAQGTLKAQRSGSGHKIGDVEDEGRRSLDLGAPRRIKVQRHGLVAIARGHAQGFARFEVHHVVTGGASVDIDRHGRGLKRHERNADFGGTVCSGLEAEPTAWQGTSTRGGRLHVKGQRHIHALQVKASRSGVRAFTFVIEIAIMVQVGPVRSVEPHKGGQVGPTHGPAACLGAAIGQAHIGHAVAQNEIPVNRQEIGRPQHHADGVVAIDAKIIGVEEHAQLVGIGLRMNRDVQEIGQRTLHSVQRELLS